LARNTAQLEEGEKIIVHIQQEQWRAKKPDHRLKDLVILSLMNRLYATISFIPL
jgi:hypothetical protein